MKIEINDSDAQLLGELAEALGGSRTEANSFLIKKAGKLVLGLVSTELRVDSLAYSSPPAQPMLQTQKEPQPMAPSFATSLPLPSDLSDLDEPLDF